MRDEPNLSARRLYVSALSIVLAGCILGLAVGYTRLWGVW